MHPYVYKKHHKPYQLLAVVILFCIMILSQPVSSSCPNYPVKRIKISSDFSKGLVRIEGNKVVASECRHNCWDPGVFNQSFLYKVTIDKHYMLLYHIKSGKFICWNKSYKKLIAKRNPPSLTYCRFEDKLSKIKDHQGSKVRYTTRDDKGREVEIRFNRSGAFAKPRFIEKCVRNFKLHQKMSWKVGDFVKLDPARIREGSTEMAAYRLLVKKCADPEFLPFDAYPCESGVPDFCQKMKILIENGHSILQQIIDLCNNEWKN